MLVTFFVTALMVMIFFIATKVEFSVGEVSLLLTLVQTILSIINTVGFEEVIFMINGMLVGSGTHGVVLNLRDDKECYKCRVGSNPARSTIREAIL